MNTDLGTGGPLFPETEISLFGLPTVKVGGRPVAFRLNKSLAALAYLVSQGQAVRRRRLATLLWGDMSEGQALTNLRVVLNDLRTNFDGHLVVTREEVSFAGGVSRRIDVEVFSAAIAKARRSESTAELVEATNLYCAPFLEGFHIDGSPEFEEFAVIERSRLEKAALGAMSELARAYISQCDWGQAIEVLTKVVRIDPWAELDRRLLMEALASSGDTQGALAEFRHLRDMLSRESGGAPEPETVKVAERISATSSSASAFFRRTICAPPTPIIGRARQLSEIEAMFSAEGVRLVTLTGPGGVGKTRLAHEFAVLTSDRCQVAMVELAGVANAERLAESIAQEIDLPLAGLMSPLEELVAGLHGVEAMLVLDNLEHLLPRAAKVVSQLHSRCPSLRLLVTSRAPLKIQAEHVLPVAPLEVPDPGAPPALLRSFPVVELFLARARAAGARDGLDDLASIALIARLFDGLPLAIELVAPRTRLFSPGEILANVQSVLDPLGRCSNDLPERHRSLADSIGWSFELLGPAARTVLLCLGAFDGGAPLGALVSVATGIAAGTLPADTSPADTSPADTSGGGDVERGRPLGQSFGESFGEKEAIVATIELVEAGLAGKTTGAAGSRLEIMESTRAFALERLKASDLLEVARRRHAYAFVEFAENADRGLRGPRQNEWMGRVGAELDNIRAALSYATASSDPKLALRLGNAFSWYCTLRGFIAEAREWLECSIQLAEDSGYRRPAGESRNENHELAELLGNARLGVVNLALRQVGDEPLSPIINMAEDDFAATGEERGRALCLYTRAYLAMSTGEVANLEICKVLIESQREAISIFEKCRDRWNEGRAGHLLSHLLVLVRDLDEAFEVEQWAQKAFLEVGDQRGVAMCHSQLGMILGMSKDLAGGTSLLVEAFEMLRSFGDVLQAFHVLIALACNLGAQGEGAVAARLFGAAGAIAKESGVSNPRAYAPIIDRNREKARRSVTPKEWRSAFDEGHSVGFGIDLGEVLATLRSSDLSVAVLPRRIRSSVVPNLSLLTGEGGG